MDHKRAKTCNNNLLWILLNKLHMNKKWRAWLILRREERILREMHNYWLTVLPFWNKRRWRHGKRSKKLEREQLIFQDSKRETRIKSRRKSMTSILIMKCVSKWVRTIISYQSNDTKKRKRSKMPYYYKRKKKQSNQKWSRLKTSRRNSWIMKELDKKIKWRTKLAYSPKD